MSGAEARRRSLIVPREHGAWGILLVPLATGAAVGLLEGGRGEPLAPLAIAAVTLFWLRTPLESLLGTAVVRARTAEERRLALGCLTGLSALAAAGLWWLFRDGRGRGLLWIGAAAALAFLAQMPVKRVWKGARAAAQAIGAAGLTATAPAAYYATTGDLSRTAFALWAANLLFAVNQIHFVQTRIAAARAAGRREKLAAGRSFLVAQFHLAAVLAAACALGYLPVYAALAFVPVLWRGFAWFAGETEPLAIHALGRRELAHACVFGVLLILGFRM